MEPLKGETLGSRLNRTSGNLPLQESLRLLRQVASALSAAHKKGIVHRDLKPDNIMLVPDRETVGGERAKLLDFGVAKLVEDVPDEKQARTKTNQWIGTPRYMSPEQCRGAGGVDDRTDVYSLGVILYQLLARRPPFVGAGSGELMAMHIYEAPPPLEKVSPDTPEQLVQLTLRMLAKGKADRPSMQEVVTALESLSASPARPSSFASRSRFWFEAGKCGCQARDPGVETAHGPFTVKAPADILHGRAALFFHRLQSPERWPERSHHARSQS